MSKEDQRQNKTEKDTRPKSKFGEILSGPFFFNRRNQQPNPFGAVWASHQSTKLLTKTTEKRSIHLNQGNHHQKKQGPRTKYLNKISKSTTRTHCPHLIFFFLWRRFLIVYMADDLQRFRSGVKRTREHGQWVRLHLYTYLRCFPT